MPRPVSQERSEDQFLVDAAMDVEAAAARLRRWMSDQTGPLDDDTARKVAAERLELELAGARIELAWELRRAKLLRGGNE